MHSTHRVMEKDVEVDPLELMSLKTTQMAWGMVVDALDKADPAWRGRYVGYSIIDNAVKSIEAMAKHRNGSTADALTIFTATGRDLDELIGRACRNRMSDHEFRESAMALTGISNPKECQS